MDGKDKLILDAAEATFAAHGFKETSVREIAGVARVNSAMLSYYFKSKEKLLEAVLERRIKRFTAKHDLLSLQPMHAGDKLLTIINWNIKTIAENITFFRFILREHLISSSPESAAIIGNYMLQRLEMIKTVLSEGVENGDFKPMDIELTGIALSGAYVNCLLNPGFFSEDSSPEILCSRLNVFFMDYLRFTNA
jgi:AcrR family transcriptional regulator